MEGRRGRRGHVTFGGTAGQGQAGEGNTESQGSERKGREKLVTTVGYVPEYVGFYG